MIQSVSRGSPPASAARRSSSQRAARGASPVAARGHAGAARGRASAAASASASAPASAAARPERHRHPEAGQQPLLRRRLKGADNAAADLGGDAHPGRPEHRRRDAAGPVHPDGDDPGRQRHPRSRPTMPTRSRPRSRKRWPPASRSSAMTPSPAVGAYNVFVNQADFNGIGKVLADMACDLAPSCTGEIAVLSAAQTATNQNAWIAACKRRSTRTRSTRASSSSTPSTATTTRRSAPSRPRASCRPTRTSRSSSPRPPSASSRPRRSSRARTRSARSP